MLRGGSWINNGRNVRSAYRNYDHPGNRNDNYGFRLARAQNMGRMALFDPILTRSATAAKSKRSPVCE